MSAPTAGRSPSRTVSQSCFVLTDESMPTIKR